MNEKFLTHYHDYQGYNHLKHRLKRDEERIQEILAHPHHDYKKAVAKNVKRCEDIQKRLDRMIDNIKAINIRINYLSRYLKRVRPSSDPSNPYRIYTTIVLDPNLLKSRGMDGLNQIIQGMCDDRIQVDLDLHLPYYRLDRLNVNVYERHPEAYTDIHNYTYIKI